MLDLHHRLKRWRAEHNQGFDGSAAATEVSVNLKIDVQRVGLNLCKNGLGAAYWARVSRLEQSILKTHVSSPRPTLVRCGLKNVLLKVELKAKALSLWRLDLLILRS
jgi:hypothetical protein